MSFINFPSQIKPSRMTLELRRSDEIFTSPITGLQQSVSRGGSYWRWTYEYFDLSETERDIVQAFLQRCKGSVNTFKVGDPANYGLRGSLSDWIDIFSGRGQFVSDLGSDTLKVNSYFAQGVGLASHISEEGLTRFEWRNRASANNVLWGAAGAVTSLEAGKAYVQRVKFFANPDKSAVAINFGVNSGAGTLIVQSAPVPVKSSDSITAPFYTGFGVTSLTAYVYATVNSGNIGDSWKLSEYRISPCALVSNSENLLTQSNNFIHADWTDNGPAVVGSGWWNASPTGVTSGGWKLYGTTATNTTHSVAASYSKITTEDIYTANIYARPNEHFKIRIVLDDQGGANQAAVIFNVGSKTAGTPTASGTFGRLFAKAWDVGSGTVRCQLTARVSSLNLIRATYQLVNSDDTFQFTNNGSAGILIAHAQLRKSPFMGQYVPTSGSTIVGTYQTGSNLVAAGFDAEDIIKAGTRLEVVNRFHDVNSGYFERSEFKRVTEEVRVHREGWAIIPIDPPIRNAPVPGRSYKVGSHLGETMHNPVIFTNPEMKARLISGTIQYIEKPLRLTDVNFNIVEELTND